MSRIVGIDFGTTKAVAAVIDAKGKFPTVIPDRKGRLSIPSVVLISEEQQFFVGWEAKEHPGRYQNEFISINSIKRSLGKRLEKSWGWLKQHPEAVAALILGRLRLEIEDHLSEEVRRAVIAIPAHFDTNQRWAVKQAAEIAGFEVVRLINEATAAAIAYSLKRPGEERILVLDFGGGTLDACVVELGEGVCEVKATAGDGLLGGDDFDGLIVEYILKEMRQRVRGFIDWTPLQQAAVSEAAVNAKIELSGAESTRIYLPGLIQAKNEFYDVDMVISREIFERLGTEFFERTEAVLNYVLKETGAGPDVIDQVLLIGGTSRIPAVREVVRRVLKRDPVTGVNPLTCVAEGAAALGGIVSGHLGDYVLLDTYPNSLSVPTSGGLATRLIARNTTIPTRKSEMFSTSTDNQTSLDVAVYEGEYSMVAYNNLLGSVTLTGIPRAPRGKPEIEVTFEIDGNGILRVTARDRSTGKDAVATITAPSRLPYEQVGIIRDIVAIEMQKVRERLTHEAEKAKTEAKQQVALDLVSKIRSLLAESGEYLPVDQVSTLRGGCDVVEDYLNREASADDLLTLLMGLRKEFDKALGSNIGRHIGDIVADPEFALWATSAAVALDSPEALLNSMNDFATRLGRQVDSVKRELRRASNQADVCSSALGELKNSIDARHCLGLLMSYYADHDALPLDVIAPLSDDEPEANPLLVLLLYSELSLYKPTRTWAEAVGHFSNVRWLKYLILKLGQVDHGNASAGEKLRACLHRVSSEDLYTYFRSIEPEKRVERLSHPAIQARLRDALLEMLRVKGVEERKFIVFCLSGLVNNASAPALLEALSTADDDDTRALIINLLPALHDSRVLRPLVDEIGVASPSVRETAQSALDKCRDLMGEDWSKKLSVHEWYEYYSAAPLSLKSYWISNAIFSTNLQKALCEVLPERTLVEQLTILDAIEMMANAEGLPDYLNLLTRITEAEPCCRFISILSALRDRHAIVPLVELLADERRDVREAASTALAGWKELLDPETERLIKITRQVVERGWPPSLRDRIFVSGYIKRHVEFRNFIEKLKQRRG